MHRICILQAQISWWLLCVEVYALYREKRYSVFGQTNWIWLYLIVFELFETKKKFLWFQIKKEMVNIIRQRYIHLWSRWIKNSKASNSGIKSCASNSGIKSCSPICPKKKAGNANKYQQDTLEECKHWLVAQQQNPTQIKTNVWTSKKPNLYPSAISICFHQTTTTTTKACWLRRECRIVDEFLA